MTEFQALALAITVLQAIDGWTTYHILKMGGVEANPVVRKLMEAVGTYAGLVVTKVFAAGLAWLLAVLPIAHANAYEIRMGAMGLLAAFYLWVSYNNYKVYKRLHGHG